jgi:hypothetical protein
MKSNTYRGGEENEKFRTTKSDSPHRQSSPDSVFLLPEASPLPKPTKQKSTSQRFEPTSDEISIEKSIDEIFLDVGKQNLSSYDEIEMIRERLLQLETIQFHGVLKIPYLLSPSSADEGKTTSSGGGVMDDLDKLNKQIEEKKAEKKSLLDKIENLSSDFDDITKFNTNFVKVSKDLLILTDNYNQIVRDNEELGFFGVNILDEDILAKKKLGIVSNTTESSSSQQDKTITKQITDQASDLQSNIDITTYNIDKDNLRGNYNKAFYAILNDYDTSPAMIIHDNEVSKLILALKNLKLEISKPEEIKLKQDSDYKNFDIAIIEISGIINGKKAEITALKNTLKKKAKYSLISWDEIKTLQLTDQTTITEEDCNKIKDLVKNKKITQAEASEILDVWNMNYKNMIDTDKILYLKGYTYKSVVRDNQIYMDVMSKINHKIFMLELKNAFIQPVEENLYVKVRYKPGQATDDPCHMFFFYSLPHKDTEIPQEKNKDFHLTIHFGSPKEEDTFNIDDFGKGRTHLRESSSEPKNSANLIPYTYKKRDTDFTRQDQCIQVIPLYQPTAKSNQPVINVGSIIVKVLNDYLQTLQIDLLETEEIKDKKLIDDLSSFLIKRSNQYLKETLQPIITKLNDDVSAKQKPILRKMIIEFYLDDTIIDQALINKESIQKFLTINKFIKQQNIYKNNIIISNFNKSYYEDIIDKANRRLEQLYIKAIRVHPPPLVLDTLIDSVRTGTLTPTAQTSNGSKVTMAVVNNAFNAPVSASAPASASAAASASASAAAAAREPVMTRSKSKTQKAARSSETEISYSDSNELGETQVASGRKKRKIKYTKKKYNKVSRKRYTKVSRKKYNKVSRKRYNKVSRKNGNYNKQ